MNRYVLGVALAFLIGMWTVPTHASDTIKLTTDDVTAIWRNINEVVLVLSKNIAMDEEWIEELRNMPPDEGIASDTASLAREMAVFRERLNVLLESSDLQAVTPMDSADPSATSALYMRSGNLLDQLVGYLIASDSLASVAIYYANADVKNATEQNLATEINLANQRMDAFLEENGL